MMFYYEIIVNVFVLEVSTQLSGRMENIDCCVQCTKYSKDYGIKVLTLGKKLTFCMQKLVRIFITLRYYRIIGVA